MTWFNRFASLIVRDRFNDDVLGSAKFYAMVNYGIANGGFMAYTTKYAVSNNIVQTLSKSVPDEPIVTVVRRMASRHRVPL